MDTNAVAKQFVDFYYQTFDGNRSNLAGLYKEMSMLSFEGQLFTGAPSIVEKLTSLPFQRVAHRVTTSDAQPGSPNGSILVTVTGQLLIDEEQNPQSFTQTFHLYPDGAGGWFVYNDIFRLVYG
ncbi:Nuclear transport factor 2 [Gaertneriomyces sp. JEL0708]|nr:nuclear transport factor 2 [Gaertneriomyces semiglobifer]KAJ3186904.1 Nuclear transport factor 2 [Gaertneriomyces sp. JEL0708]